MFEVLDRAGLARDAKWTPMKGALVETPNILFHSSPSFPVPQYADATLIREGDGMTIHIGPEIGPTIPLGINRPLVDQHGSADMLTGKDVIIVKGIMEREVPKDAELYVLGNAFELRRDARAFVETVLSLRKAIGYNRPIYAPGIMEPSNLALLAYMGLDLFDSSLLIYQASRGKALIPEGTLPVASAPWLLNGETDATRHNMDVAWSELQLLKHMIRIGRLRELVENRVNATPWAVAVLRIMDLEHYDFQEKFTSVVGPSFYCNSKQSLFRPDVWRFRKRILERYEVPSHKKVLLLIPCSAKKPYHTSKSHRMFEEVMYSVPNTTVVQELIITSPLGAVPRELELFYPAAQYDIPVTGNWDKEEVAMVQELVAKVASHGFDKVICHLGTEGEFIKPILDCIITSEHSTTTDEALSSLRKELMAACEAADKTPRHVDRVEFLRSAVRFQFGKDAGQLLDGCEVVGNYPYLKIFHGKTQLGMLTPDRGMISLTFEGGEALMGKCIGQIEIGDFELKGNLFAVGIISADESIRPGDEVIMTHNGRLEGVGVANMSGTEMSDAKRGEAVRVRHKRKV